MGWAYILGVPLSPTQVSLIGVFGSTALAGVVSFLVARYTLRNNPNYEEKIQSIYQVLASLAQTQEAFRQQHEKSLLVEQKQIQATQWRPKAHITSEVEGNEQVNKLILKAQQEFCVNEVSLLSSSGTKLHEYPVMGPKVFSQGFSIPISHASLILIANSSQSYFQHSTFEGKFRYSVALQDSVSSEGELPFHAEITFVNNTVWFKLKG